MRREKAINVFLFFLLQAMLFVCFCPIYFSVGIIHVRTVSLPERMFSLLFVLLWLSLCVYTAWKKRLSLLVGGALYAVMAYLPGWFLPHLAVPAGSIRAQGLIAGLLETFFNKMYELVSAPLAGVSLLVSEKASTSISRWLLPILLIGYAGTHMFRFYHNAYLAEQLHLDETTYFSNPALARELAVAPGSAVSSGMASPEELFPEITDRKPATPPAALPGSAAIALPANMQKGAGDNGPEDNDQTRLHFPGLQK